LDGRLKAAIAKKSFAASQLKIVIDTANIEISRLQGLIASSNAAIDKLGIDGLKANLSSLLGNLQNSYTSYNQVQSKIPAVQAHIDGHNQ
jgi:hypothetical protein